MAIPGDIGEQFLWS